MYINQIRYDVGDVPYCINVLRNRCYTSGFYSNPDIVQDLIKIINNRSDLDCQTVEYDSNTYTFTLKIKKTSMRKIHGTKFVNHPIFYYEQIIPGIFYEYMMNNKEKIINVLQNDPQVFDPYMFFNSIISDPAILSKMCHITCLSDNIIIIKL